MSEPTRVELDTAGLIEVLDELVEARAEIGRLRAALEAIRLGLSDDSRLPRTTVQSIATAALRDADTEVPGHE